ncbi:hypothetical protein [Limnoglobus roseus]|uniref:AP2/ERF domain-containing protein n=1 Tax=Limnoglobus roseus TaxID=2598579 RepID=A0A5C1A571_9BACT|nr:hypothetical protein [Limnoglobus roseus]QEL14279.1 hypothetical protein PX52LOC_01150 [Limnoglobus roseus]
MDARGNSVRAITSLRRRGRRRTVSAAALVANPPRGCAVAHRNFDALDVRRENLVVLSKRAARSHSPRPVRGVPGVSRAKAASVWVAHADDRRGRRRFLGTYPTLAAAQKAVAKAALAAGPPFVWAALEDPAVCGSKRLLADVGVLIQAAKASPGASLAERAWRLHRDAVLAAEAPKALPPWLLAATADPRISSSTRHLALLGGLIASWAGDPDALARRAWEMVVEGVPAYTPPPLRRATPTPTPTPTAKATATSNRSGSRTKSAPASK